MEKHINKIAIAILKEEYSDYPENDWHYNREYRMLVKAQNRVKKLNLHRVSVSSSFKRLKVELDAIKKFSDKNYKEDSKSGVDVVHLQMMDYINEEQKRY